MKDRDLTPEEIAKGYHYCPEWDYLLLEGPSMEWDSCTCPEPEIKAAKQRWMDSPERAEMIAEMEKLHNHLKNPFEAINFKPGESDADPIKPGFGY